MIEDRVSKFELRGTVNLHLHGTVALLRVKLNKDNTRASDVICEKKGKLCNISVQIMWQGESIIQQIIAIFSEVTSHCFTKFEIRKILF